MSDGGPELFADSEGCGEDRAASAGISFLWELIGRLAFAFTLRRAVGAVAGRRDAK